MLVNVVHANVDGMCVYGSRRPRNSHRSALIYLSKFLCFVQFTLIKIIHVAHFMRCLIYIKWITLQQHYGNATQFTFISFFRWLVVRSLCHSFISLSHNYIHSLRSWFPHLLFAHKVCVYEWNSMWFCHGAQIIFRVLVHLIRFEAWQSSQHRTLCSANQNIFELIKLHIRIFEIEFGIEHCNHNIRSSTKYTYSIFEKKNTNIFPATQKCQENRQRERVKKACKQKDWNDLIVQ